MNTQTQMPVRQRRGVKLGIVAAVIAIVIALVALVGFGGKSATQGMSMAGMSTSANAGKSGATATTAVAIKNFAFSPETITVKAGSTVTWTNNDSVDHTVTFDGNTVSSSDLGMNDTFSHAFPTPGTYHYICTIHPFMHGTVIVTG
jgi:amicyanin